MKRAYVRYEYACCVCCGLRVFMIQYSVLLSEVIIELVLVPRITSYFLPIHPPHPVYNLLSVSVLISFYFTLYSLMHFSISSS